MTGGTIEVPGGGYRYIPGVFQYSAGVAALDGFQIERVTFQTPVPLAGGFAFIERYLTEQGVPLLAFCACELRSPGAIHRGRVHRVQPALLRHAGALGRHDRTTTTRSPAATFAPRSISPPSHPSTRFVSPASCQARPARS